jgi:serine/threonine protein kinase
LLGVGGTAAVYQAQHRNGKRVAIKMLHRRAALSETQLFRFHREGYVANRVDHPGVVEIFDDDVAEDGTAFLVMEFLSGRTIAELAKERGDCLSTIEVLDYADRLLDVLVAAHAKRILHRDIKPENLFVTTDGDLKVLDFGIARITEPSLGWAGTVDGTMLGTPAFAPPEQARGRIEDIDARSDVWAVGATMFTLLTGRHVHQAGTPAEQFGLAMSSSAPSLGEFLKDAPAALVALVDRALAYEREERWPSAAAMQHAVQWLRDAWPRLRDEPSFVPVDWQIDTSPGTQTLEHFELNVISATKQRWKRAGTVVAIAAVAMVALPSSRRSPNPMQNDLTSVDGPRVEAALRPPALPAARVEGTTSPYSPPALSPALPEHATGSERRRVLVRSSPSARVIVHPVERPATPPDPTTPVLPAANPERANGLPVATAW